MRSGVLFHPSPPPKPKRGRRALSDDRSLINGILYVATTGFRWRWNA